MPSVGFEPTIPAFQRAKTVHALDRAVTVIDTHNTYSNNTLILILLHGVWGRKKKGERKKRKTKNPLLYEVRLH
jgi:hypothetical protein